MNVLESKRLAGSLSNQIERAKALLRMKYPDGAYYRAGYAVECALKACIAKATLRHDFPERKRVDDSHTHNLEKLMKLANLEEAWFERMRTDSVFRDCWDLVQSWSEQSRYRRSTLEAAKGLLNAVDNKKHERVCSSVRNAANESGAPRK